LFRRRLLFLLSPCLRVTLNERLFPRLSSRKHESLSQTSRNKTGSTFYTLHPRLTFSQISIRAFLPLFVHLYILQFLLLPVLAHQRFPSVLLSNSIHLAAFTHSVYVTFCGYNVLPSLQGTQVLLVAPLVVGGMVWLIATVGGWNATLSLAPVLWAGGGLRGGVGGGHSGT
jgi:hypothetical protein